jgi:hypothetical protein
MSNKEIKSQQLGITTSFEPFKNVEWAFQFNNDEPIKFAEPDEFNTDKGLTFTLGNRGDSNIVFTDGKGNEFKLFARERVNK